MVIYYLDTNAIFTYYNDTSRGHLSLRRALSASGNQTVALVSALTQLEYINALLKEYRRGRLRKSQVLRSVNRFARDTAEHTTQHYLRPFQFAAVEDVNVMYRRAENLLLIHGAATEFGSIDALHIATAEQLQTQYPDLTLVTSDAGVKRVCAGIKLKVFDPEV